MRLFHIQEYASDPINELFEKACEQKSVEYVAVIASNLGNILEQPPTRGDFVYNSGTGSPQRNAEAMLVNEHVATFYRRVDGVLFRRAGGKGVATLHLERHGIAVPKTVYYVDADRRRLAESVDEVGGFPVILKAREGQWGLGVVLVDGFDSLVSMVEFMMQKGEHSLVMQEFVEHDSVLRTVTIGDRVVVSRRVNVLPGDFRSATMDAVLNEYTDSENVSDLSHEAMELSIRATHTAGVDFSGIDILEAKDGRLLVSEVNFPCMHARIEKWSGVPVSALMIDFLMEKSRRMASFMQIRGSQQQGDGHT